MMIPDGYGYDNPWNVVGTNTNEAEEDDDMSENDKEVSSLWRICLKRAAADFDRAVPLFLSEVSSCCTASTLFCFIFSI